MGKPVAKSRPRFWNGRAVTDPKTREAEQRLLVYYKQAARGRKPYTGSITVEMVFIFTPPKSWPAKKQADAIAQSWPHTKRPDIDNLVKLLDGLNGYAWVDDSQIANVRATKQYGIVDKTEITIIFEMEQ